MNKFLKFFPFMPGTNETGKLILAVSLYQIVLPFLVTPIISILAITIILSPVAVLIGYVLNAYVFIGLVLAVLHYTGYDFSAINNSAE